MAYTYRTSLYLAASASAEFFADIMLAPMEATKIRIQTMPGAPPTLRGCFPMIYRTEGLMGFYKVCVCLCLCDYAFLGIATVVDASNSIYNDEVCLL
jgi:hypothetical protein